MTSFTPAAEQALSYPSWRLLTATITAFMRDFPLNLLLILLFAGLAGYLGFRCFSLKHALRDICRDLTEIRQDLSRNQILHLPLPDRDLENLTESLNAALAEIRQERLSYEKREAEFQQLIENISHDLRTPLTVILGYLKWMRRAEEIPSPDSPHRKNTLHRTEENQPQTLDIIERNARSMEKLVSQFYAFSRLHARDYAPKLQDTDVCRILRESLADHYQLLEDARLELCARLPERPVTVRGSGEALERIFSNLLQNAARYALSRLDVCLEETEGQPLRITFQNDTEQLRPEDIPHLFDRFYKSDASRRQGGSGLGLTVAKSLAEAMNGTLTAELVPETPDTVKTDAPVVTIRLVLTLTVPTRYCS